MNNVRRDGSQNSNSTLENCASFLRNLSTGESIYDLSLPDKNLIEIPVHSDVYNKYKRY